jgi:hypothetical protein
MATKDTKMFESKSAATKDFYKNIHLEKPKSARSDKPKLRRSNSTSSLYITSSVVEPSSEQMLVKTARLLTFMIAEPSEPQESSWPAPRAVQAKKPALMGIFSYIATVYKIGKWSEECNLIMIVLISRFVSAAKLQFDYNNWHLVLLIAFMIAQKVWDDLPLGNREFVELLQIITELQPNSGFNEVDLQCINRMEREFLKTIHYDVFVKRRVAAEFLFELDAFQRAYQVDCQGDIANPHGLLGVPQARLLGLSCANSPHSTGKKERYALDNESAFKSGSIVVLS